MASQSVCKPVKCASHSIFTTRSGHSIAIGRSLAPAQQQRFGEASALSSVKSAAPKVTLMASHYESCANTIESEPNQDNSIAAVALDGVSFAPAGLLYPYYVGVGAALQDLRLINANTRRESPKLPRHLPEANLGNYSAMRTVAFLTRRRFAQIGRILRRSNHRRVLGERAASQRLHGSLPAPPCRYYG